MCDMYHPHGDEEGGFLGLASKPMATVYQWFSLKTTMTVCQWFDLKITRTVFFDLALKLMATVFLGLASKLVAQVSRFGPSNRQLRFGDLDLKITMTVSWFAPQIQLGDGLSVASQTDGGRMTRDTCQDLAACLV
jgi:hypothetical protein